jgi:hypothetical protein
MATATLKVTIVDDSVTPVPVDGVKVLILDNLGAFVTEGYTGQLSPGTGEVEFTVDAAPAGTSYYIWMGKAGWVILPGSVSVEAIFPLPTVNAFQFTAQEGMTGLVSKVVTMTDDVTPVPVEDVTIKVFSAADVFLYEDITDLDGVASFVLEGLPTPGKDYIIRLSKPGLFSFEGGSSRIISVIDPLGVHDTNIFDITVHETTLPESSNPDMCLVSGYLKSPSLVPLKGSKLRFLPQAYLPKARVGGYPFTGDPNILNRDILGMVESEVIADKNGYIEIQLPRKSIMNIVAHSFEMPGINDVTQVYIPDLPAARLEDILFPFVSRVDYSPLTASVAAGSTFEIPPIGPLPQLR